MYISDKFQPEYYKYIIALNPNRVIFNPGTENLEFEEAAALRDRIRKLEKEMSE